MYGKGTKKLFIITANKELYIALQTKLNDLTKKV